MMRPPRIRLALRRLRLLEVPPEGVDLSPYLLSLSCSAEEFAQGINRIMQAFIDSVGPMINFAASMSPIQDETHGVTIDELLDDIDQVLSEHRSEQRPARENLPATIDD